MRRAFEGSGLSPADVTLLECHATGTPIGDRTEVQSTTAVYGEATDLPIGSLKSNLGHLITAAGVAGLIKVLEAMRHETRPPSLLADPQTDAVNGTPLRVLTAPEPWTGRRIAGVSAFGFGGNNAHVLVEQYTPDAGVGRPPAPVGRVRLDGVELSRGGGPLAVVGLSILADPDEVVLPMVRFPPRDLQQTLAQQLLLMQAMLEAAAGLDLDGAHTSVLVGMGTDPEVARYGARWRLPGWQEACGVDESARDGFVPVLKSAGVIGTMPNIPANRINSQLDLHGPSMTVSAEELSGVRALEIAARQLRTREVDLALVGAVDLSDEPVHAAAAERLGLTGSGPADAAVVLVVERLADARANRHPVIAIFDEGAAVAPTVAPRARAHAASGLLAVAGAVAEAPEGEVRTLEISALESRSARVTVIGGPASPTRPEPPARALRFPLHPQEVRVSTPTTPTASSPDTFTPTAPLAPTGPETMDPAPALAPILLTTAPPATATVTATPPAAAPPSPEVGGPLSLVAGLHRQFAAQQAQLQQRFLQLRQKQLDMLRERAGGTPRPTPNVAAHQPTPAPAPVVVPMPAPEAVVVPIRPAKSKVYAEIPNDGVGAGPQASEGPTFDRAALEVHAAGKISSIFGPLFEQQDGFQRQVRMPTPPLLLCDRVTGLRGEAGSMGKGTIWTETDVRWDRWYLHDGRMPAGVMIESGQADLMLISYLGADFHNKGERMYRLLGCELTYRGGLPQPGDTLQYDIHVDGHARQGDVRLFFFHYDCKVDGATRLSVRGGQAGFFTEAELAESAGVLWSAEEATPCANPRLDPPTVATTRTSLTHEQLVAFSEGRVVDCFGPGFEPACPHTRTPRIGGGRMLWLDEVTHLDHAGGPWGRGYLRAVDPIAPDDWFFDGHFLNDPCMPGTMMFEGCLQAMAVYLTSLGYTLDKDGWVFEPVPDTAYPLRCRGEVDPDSQLLEYEVFVEEIEDGPHPTIWADLLCTVDGLKAFHCQRMGLRLVPAFPMDSRPDLPGPLDDVPVAVHEGFSFDFESLLACAWGKPSSAFGALYQPFDAIGKVPRLPSPPYHFMTRVTQADGVGVAKPGAAVTVEYDIPEDVWYFRENGCATMPFCVLLEAALQPCGWLASGVGSIVGESGPLFFRNLDGTGTLHRELLPGDGTLVTKVKLTSVSKSAGMIIEGFEVQCLVGDEPIYDMTTVFGFFPGEALANQIGLPKDEVHQALNDAAATERPIELRTNPEAFCRGPIRLPAAFLRMIDGVDGIWPGEGEAGLARYRSIKRVDPNEWYFKAHFHQDPVQPGSLGIEAMIQLLQLAMLDRGLHEGFDAPRFEPLQLDGALTWKYRGQVRPHNEIVRVTLELTDEGRDERGAYAICDASLWVDGMRIYEASNLGMRIVDGTIDTAAWTDVLKPNGEDAWVRDHCPTWTVPALPMASMLDRLAAAAAGEGRLVVGLDDVRVRRWLVVDEDTPIRAEVHRRAESEKADVTLSNDDGPIASGTVLLGCSYTTGPAPLVGLEGEPQPDPYDSGVLFHGPAFQALKTLVQTEAGASALLEATPGSIPSAILNPRLVDAATHAIPHDQLERWCPEIEPGQVAYPAMVTRLRLHGPTPTEGDVRCEVRFAGFHGDKRFPAFDVQLVQGDRVWATLRLVEALFPKGRLGAADPQARRAFLRDRQWSGITLSRPDGDATRLTADEVAGSDWLPGTVQALYGTTDPAAIVEKEHVAARVGVHPGALPTALPLNTLPVTVTVEDRVFVARTGAEETLDIGPVRTFWTDWFARDPWPVEDLYYGLIRQFVRRIVVAPKALDAIADRSALYLGNHQTGVESLLFSILASGLTGVPTVTLAKAEHRHTWLGKLIAHCFTYPGVTDPEVITFFDRDDKESLPRIIGDLAARMKAGKKSVMVHIEGTRSLECRTPVQKMSGAFIDMALGVDAPIVPVRFVGGLPAERMESRIEFPIGMGTQDIWFGEPLWPADLAAIPYGDRKKRVIAAINGLGPSNATEQPNPARARFAERVAAHRTKTGVDEEHAALYCVLQDSARCAESKALLAGDPFEGDATAWLTELRRRLVG